MNRIRTLLFVALSLATVPAWAQLPAVATTSDLGVLARVIGGDRVSVKVLAPPDRDPHHLDARPSMIQALRRADLLVATGASLEAGWLPAAIQSAANPRILPGRPGHFEGAAQVDLLGAGQPADRSRGDVHPEGNPHFSLDPVRYARVGVALAERLAELDPAGAADFRRRAADLSQAVAERLPAWQVAVEGAPGAVLYHQDMDYLMHRLDVPVLGYLEPVPGVPPTGAHLQRLVQALRGQAGVLLYHPYHPERPAERLAAQLDWPAVSVPLYPPVDGEAVDYFALIDRYVAALSGAPAR